MIFEYIQFPEDAEKFNTKQEQTMTHKPIEEMSPEVLFEYIAECFRKIDPAQAPTLAEFKVMFHDSLQRQAAVAELQAKNEALEREVERSNVEIKEGNILLTAMKEAASHWQARAETLEAQAAAMRLALEKIRNNHYSNPASISYATDALANDAGKELLEENQRLRKALESARDFIKFVDLKRDDLRQLEVNKIQEALQGKGE